MDAIKKVCIGNKLRNLQKLGCQPCPTSSIRPTTTPSTKPPKSSLDSSYLIFLTANHRVSHRVW